MCQLCDEAAIYSAQLEAAEKQAAIAKARSERRKANGDTEVPAAPSGGK
jgi:hypothetical protein